MMHAALVICIKEVSRLGALISKKGDEKHSLSFLIPAFIIMYEVQTLQIL